MTHSTAFAGSKSKTRMVSETSKALCQKVYTQNGKAMKLSEHNNKMNAATPANADANVECDGCAAPMRYDDTLPTLMSYPPKRPVMCTKCGYASYKTMGFGPN